MHKWVDEWTDKKCERGYMREEVCGRERICECCIVCLDDCSSEDALCISM